MVGGFDVRAGLAVGLSLEQFRHRAQADRCASDQVMGSVAGRGKAGQGDGRRLSIEDATTSQIIRWHMQLIVGKDVMQLLETFVRMCE